jgi:lipopolysaccharide transport system permease protein
VASALVTEFIGLAVFVVAASLVYQPPGWSLLLLPVVIAFQVMLTLGLGWFLASLNVFLRDVGQFLGLGLTLWMLLTPIFYPPDMVPPRFRWVMAWNPFHYVVQGYRDVLLDHRLPQPAHLVALGTIAAAAFLGGSWFFRRSKNAFIDVI